MANVRAIKSGNWSDTTVWNTGVLPTSSDDVYSNTYTVTIDISPTVLSIQNGSATNITAGGGFVISSNGITLTCTAASGIIASTATCLTVTVSSPSSCSVNANAVAGNSGSHGILFSGTGTLNHTGNLTGGTAASGPTGGMSVSGTGTVNIVGSCIGTNNQSHGVNISGNATVNITGNVLGASNGSTNLSFGVHANANAIITIIGSINSGSLSAGLGSGVAHSLTHIGTSTATNDIPAISSSNTGATVILTGPFIASANGTHAVLCPNWKWQNTNPPPTYYQIRSANLSTLRPLYTADYVGGNPATSNVRNGTIYGPSNELTGTCIIPPTQSVYFGVPVDNTTGTLSLTPDVIWNYPISNITTSGSIGERLKNAATVSTVGTILSNALR